MNEKKNTSNIFLRTAIISTCVVALLSAGFIYAFTGPGALTAGTGSGSIYASSSGNIGIGTTNPLKLLEVANSVTDGSIPTIRISGWNSSVNGGTGGLSFYENHYANQEIGRIDALRGGGANAGIFTFSVTNGATLNEAMRIDASGYVGIATTTPGQALTVNGNVQANSFIGTLSGAVAAGNVSSGQFGSLQSGGNFTFPASVGIGTTTPTYTLSVKGNIQIASSSNGLIFPDGTKQTTAATGGMVSTSTTFTTSGTWTRPAGVSMVNVTICGGGGGGGGGANSGYGGTMGGGGGGGAGACYISIPFNATSSSYSYVIGVGGSGGSGSVPYDGVTGNNGGNSSFGPLSANGGSGGEGGYSGSGAAMRGRGGWGGTQGGINTIYYAYSGIANNVTSTAISVAAMGGAGGAYNSASGNPLPGSTGYSGLAVSGGAAGGAGVMSGGGGGGGGYQGSGGNGGWGNSNSGPTNGSNGSGYGSGGGGGGGQASVGGTGGTGASGVVILQWWQ